MTYKCLYCSRTFATPYALKRHISDKHPHTNIDESEGETSHSNMPYEEPGLWDDDLTMEDVWAEPTTSEPTIESHEDLRSLEIADEESEKSNETDKEVDKEIDEEIDEEIDNLTFPLSIDSEDFHGTTLDDAINDKMHPPNTEWPNDIYREFMEIVMEYQLSNSCGDRIIKLINKSRRHDSDENPLPKNTKEGRKFLDMNEFPYMKFKTVPITNFQDTDYNFYYQPIIHGIKVLLLQPEINKEFIFKYRNTTVTAYGEQFESE